jgi:hypothetical protein
VHDPVLISRIDSCGYALVDIKSHVSKNSKVTMFRLLGGVISELVLMRNQVVSSLI